MVKYWCYRNHSQEADSRIEEGQEPIAISSSECPVCRDLGKDTHQYVECEFKVYWCDCCKIPLYEEQCSLCGSKGKAFAKDVRPVFPKERLLLELLTDREPGALEHTSLWNAAGNIYYADGEKIPLSIKSLRNRDVDKIRECFWQHEKDINEVPFRQMIKRFVKANEMRYHEISTEAISYIQEETSGVALTDMFTSFSGGKDSTVVADLARRALATDKLLHIFGDTTLEFPETQEYVKRYRKEHPKTPFLSSRNKDKDFLTLCEQVGPPSRVMRWCCTIFKTGAINRKISALFRNKNRIISFQGIRRQESASRSKYERTSGSSKIAKQVALAPIIDWFDMDIWLYLLTTGISFNPAYELGYTRVGCWCCPNNSEWSEFLSRVHMPEQYQTFRNMLVSFATQIGKPDAEEYVDSGAWKARQGGNGVAYAKRSIVDYTPCVKEENTVYYELQKPITSELYELFKPFGELHFEMGNARLGEVYVLDNNQNPVLKLAGRIGKTKLKVTIYRVTGLRARNFKSAKEKVDCQITKYQMCMGCRGCESACRFNAISVKENKDGTTAYMIDKEKCVGCQECIGHFIGGCYMRKVLAIKRR